MKTRIIILNTIIFFSLCILGISCSSLKYSDNRIGYECLKLNTIVSKLFKNYNIFIFYRSNGEKLYILSEKDSNSFDRTNYDTLKIGNDYCMNINIIDSTVTDPLSSYNGQDHIIIDNVII